MEPQWLTAIATVLLAVIAVVSIFRGEIRAWLRHPDFEPRFLASQPDCHRVPLRWRLESSSGEALVHYVRCRVRNTGKVAAKDVEVTVTEVRRKDAAGTFRIQRLATPWNLLWSHYNSHVLPQLPPETERHITVGHVVDPQQRSQIPYEDDPNRSLGPNATLFCLEVFVKSNTLEYLLDPGEYEIVLEVAAANAWPKIFTFQLNHTGAWFENEESMYSEGLGLRIA